MEWKKLLSNQRAGGKSVPHDPARSAFEQDFDRIIFSHPFRRLQDKTQVHPLPKDDFVHTRLTHSLEVSSVGRSLGKNVGKVLKERYSLDEFSVQDIGSIVAAASLCHDIGNPPFGHSGEEAISEFYRHGQGRVFESDVSPAQWEDLIRFEGNAQGFRLLNKSRYQGLKLTAATLAAFTKYPRPSLVENPDKTRRSQKKYGFFCAEKEAFRRVADTTGLIALTDETWCRHPLAFLVEAADDICYHLIDLEDGCRLGLVSYNDTVDLYRLILRERFNASKFEKIKSREERIGTLRAMAIGVLIDECTELFLEREADLREGKNDRSLTDDIPSAQILREIIKISIEHIYRSRQVMETEVAGFEVLPGLLGQITLSAANVYQKNQPSSGRKTLLRLLPEDLTREMQECADTYELLMLCNDFVSGLTDSHAIHLYRGIKGISLPG
ncbi:deoxyguanosinetriphosphate triphosphohydrolase [Fulvivirga sedimenti]|uniref:Deoxyguanosinetriphosphate triphosphohydrolase n=1 Tax=Fulvivirga sedimenti TaxID=2879465 RepID=A0A9X1HUS4_9BACT|nr:deoxyguanosinetriphosphate triphosphohydrolase [Fulvivirga sedimenti]MCA6078291.1 deoxyguanosinetriphosphate triphosphohydrolase [Fulvivirga sedimenti]